MNIFDFDNTLYDGESSFDFFFFCLRKDKKLAIYIPMMVIDLILYKSRLIHVNRLYADTERLCRELMKNEDQIEDNVSAFWKIAARKLKPEICSMIHPEDVIVTASPQFLLKGIMGQLYTKNLVASQIDTHRGKVETLCFREEKIIQFQKYFKGTVECFYTDSLNDRAMIEYAKKAYLVKGTNLQQIK